MNMHIIKAAEELRTTKTNMLMLLKTKAVIGEERDGEWYVDSDSLECFKAHGKDIKGEMGCRSYCSSSGCGCK